MKSRRLRQQYSNTAPNMEIPTAMLPKVALQKPACASGNEGLVDGGVAAEQTVQWQAMAMMIDAHLLPPWQMQYHHTTGQVFPGGPTSRHSAYLGGLNGKRR